MSYSILTILVYCLIVEFPSKTLVRQVSIDLTPYRENYALLPPGTSLIMYIVLIPFTLIFLYGLYIRLRAYGFNALLTLSKDFRSWFTQSLRYSILQKRIIREIIPGMMHLTTSYGILVLFIGTLLVFIDSDFLEPFNQKLLQGTFYLIFEFILDIFGLFLIFGIILQLIRRYSGVKRLKPKLEYYLYLWGLLFIGVSGFLLESIRISVTQPPWSSYSPIGNMISKIIMNLGIPSDVLKGLYQVLWWSHAITAFGLIAALPYTNLRHTIVSFIYTGLTYSAPRLPQLAKTPFKLSEVDLSSTEELKIGFRKISDLDWLQKMGLDGCTDCGRCEAVCPAYSSGTPLSPRNLVQKLMKIMWKNRLSMERDLIESKDLGYDEVYACTTCGGCVEECPVVISPLEYIIEARRAFVIDGRIEKKAIETLNNLSRVENPYGLPKVEREALVKELRNLGAKTVDEHPEAEYIYWVGCLATYDPRIRNVARKMVEILSNAGIDFAILGTLEKCTGEPARRMGEEGLFQELALKNIETLKSVNAKKLIVHCPHCYQIFKNEYRELGLKIEVIHHSVLLRNLMSQGRIKPKIGIDALTTFHDSCYIARFNNIINEPRELLAGLRFREMGRRGKDTFCCGAGGGNYWSEVKRIKRESLQRLEEAMKINAEVIIVECPYCIAMLEDAVRVMGLEEKIKILDISEVF
jgi:Fe-S oxidoreductase